MGHLALLLLTVLAVPIAAAAELEFEGTPSLKLDVLEGVVQTQVVPPERARDVGVKIARTANGYVWASRNNVPLSKHESDSYVTYIATTGAGYIRVYSPVMRKMIQALPPDQREKEYVYMEHMVNQLGSITYFGK